jgi:hypothetical protein
LSPSGSAYIKNSEDDPDIRWIMLKKKIIAL